LFIRQSAIDISANAVAGFADDPISTVRSKGCLSNKSALAMIFKLAEAAELAPS
jgi:hypothetical protein